MITQLVSYDYDALPFDCSPIRTVRVTANIVDNSNPSAPVVVGTYSASAETDTTIEPAQSAPALIAELVGKIAIQWRNDQQKKANLAANIEPFTAAFQQALDAAIGGA